MEENKRLLIIKKAYDKNDFYSLIAGDDDYISTEPFSTQYFDDGWKTPELQKVSYYKL